MLAAEFIDKLHVSVIVAAGGGPSAFAAKAATKTIPIVFTYAADPVQAGIVASWQIGRKGTLRALRGSVVISLASASDFCMMSCPPCRQPGY